jgi:hypothetical protein
LPKRNFGFEKRQKELEKQRKRAQKLLRRSERGAEPALDPETGLPIAEEADQAEPAGDSPPTE